MQRFNLESNFISCNWKLNGILECVYTESLSAIATLKPGIGYFISVKTPAYHHFIGKIALRYRHGNLLGVGLYHCRPVKMFCRNRFALNICRLPEVAIQMQHQFS